MMNMTANEYMYVNKNTLKVTDESDADAIEFVRFYLKGQSFLFNQIRKMVGSMIQVFHGELGPGYIENTHKENRLQVALSPGDGLLLERVAYDQYNSMPTTHSPIMMVVLPGSMKELSMRRFSHFIWQMWGRIKAGTMEDAAD